MIKPEEKRAFKRFKFKKILKVSVVVPSKSGHIYEVHPQSFETFSHNISEGGLRMDNRKRLGKDVILKVNVELAGHKVVEAFGKVTWADSHQCGLNFLMQDMDFKKGVRQLVLRTALNV